MNQFAIALAALAVGAGFAVAEGSPFDGTWKLNVEKSQFTGDTFTYADTATGYRFSNGATVAYDFAIDGQPHPMIADRTVTWTKAGDNAWDTTVEAGDTVMTKGHRTAFGLTANS